MDALEMLFALANLQVRAGPTPQIIGPVGQRPMHFACGPWPSDQKETATPI